MYEILNLFLLGYFTEFIEKVKNEFKNSLLKICYLESLLELNRFDEYYEEIEKIQNNTEKDLLKFYFKLFTLRNMPSYYYSKFAETKDYYYEFQNLFKKFYEYISTDSNSSYFDFIKLNICCLTLNFVETFFELHKFSFFEYTEVKKNVLDFTQKLEFKYNNLSNKFLNKEEENIWKALIFDYIGAVYSFYDYLNEKETLYYEKSVFHKLNIFAVTDLIDKFIDEEKEEEAKIFLENLEFNWNFNKPIDESEYFLFFDTRAQLFEKEKNKEKAEKDYYRAINIVEKKIKYKGIFESYPYYNLALLKKEIKEYQIAENYLNKALQIFKKASDINSCEEDNIIYFLEDFQDYLYEKCNVQISQNKKDYSNTLKCLFSISERLNKLGYRRLKGSVEYDIALLKSKIYDIQKKYNEMIEYLKNCLTKEEGYLSDKEKSELRAWLAYGYLKISKLNEYHENIQKSLELDPSNKTALKLISQERTQSLKIFDKEHLKHISKMGGILLIILIFLILLISGSKKFGLVSYSIGDFTFFVIISCFLIPIYIIIFFPLIKSLKIGSIEVEFKGEIPPKEPKIEQ